MPPRARCDGWLVSHILLVGSVIDPLSIELTTRKGCRIDNAPGDYRDPLSMRAAHDIHRNAFPDGRILLRALDYHYNCVGMVFANRRTAIDSADVERILVEDEYEQCANLHVAARGDVAIYRRDGEVCHVGLVIEATPDLGGGGPTKIRVLSKWGRDGEYEHDVDDVPPLYGRLAEVWTCRRGMTR